MAMIWVSHNFGTGTRSLPKRVFVQCVRVQKFWDTHLQIAQPLASPRVSVSKNFGTRNHGPVPRLFLRLAERNDSQGVSIIGTSAATHGTERNFQMRLSAHNWIIGTMQPHSNEIITTIVGIMRPGGSPKTQPILPTRRIVRQQMINAISTDYQCNRRPQHSNSWPQQEIIVKRHYRRCLQLWLRILSGNLGLYRSN